MARDFKTRSGISDIPPSLVCKDGTEVRLCPLNRTNGKPIYCSQSGLFFSYTTGELKKVKPYANLHFKSKCNVHSDYPKLQHYLGNTRVHMLMALTWLGERPEGMVIDHLNGNILDWSADNLEYVTPDENRKRAKLLRVLRSIGRDPKQMSRTELLNIFNKYTFTEDVKLEIVNE